MTALTESPPPTAARGGESRTFLRRLTAIASGGMFIDGYVLGTIGAVNAAISKDLGLSAAWQGLIAASALIGIFFGGPLGGYLSDRFGRKRMFTLDMAVFVVGSALQFLVDTGWQLFLVRLLMGIGIGAEYSIGWPLLAEFAPTRLRGKLLALQEFAWYLGYIASYAIGYGLGSAYDLDWRIILATSTVPAVILFIARAGTPESPRWLMSKGRVEEAKAIAERYFEDPTDIADLADEQVRKASFWRLFSPAYLKVTVFICVFWFCTVTPYFAIASFAPTVLADFGLGDGFMGALWVNGLALAGAGTTFVLIERVGRRKLVIPQFWTCALALGVVGFWPTAAPVVILLCFLLFAYTNAMSTAVTGVYPNEVFSTDIRGAGIGLATATSRIGAALGTFLVPTALSTIGVGPTMLVAAALCVIGAVVTQITAPETRGLPLSVTSAPAQR
ncbi:MFS transporter [Streptomyces cavernicola]|uniref:MFS transporter n=1 Tax=Streptomyces cavernicola TaxID=3043613 RepID=A0ABT6SEM4_9ACTN|nr:MFS transporter [Streptomyces sp. B-S-A6]MDI3406424.1 MFS transporter [Streptomyces sp. B-S-A6]